MRGGGKGLAGRRVLEEQQGAARRASSRDCLFLTARIEGRGRRSRGSSHGQGEGGEIQLSSREGQGAAAGIMRWEGQSFGILHVQRCTRIPDARLNMCD